MLLLHNDVLLYVKPHPIRYGPFFAMYCMSNFTAACIANSYTTHGCHMLSCTTWLNVFPRVDP